MRTQQLISAILNTILISLLFHFTGQNTHAQYFVKSYDFPPFTTRTEQGRSIERDYISGWSITGNSNSTPNAGANDWMFLRLDNSGLLKCSALLGFSGNDTSYTHVQLNTTNKEYVLAGSYFDVNSGKNKASFSIVDTNCNHVMSKQIMDTLEHTYRQVVNNPSNIFTLAGYTEDPFNYGGGLRPNKILTSQYLPNGVLAWAFNYLTGVPSTEEAYSICHQLTDGSYAITGRTNFKAGPGALFDVFVTKLTPAGIPIWTKIYIFPMPGVNSDARRIIPMPDGGFVIIGWTNVFDPAANDIWVFRINSFGFPMWSTIYGTPSKVEKGYSIILATDGTLVFTGYTNTLGTEDILTVKIPAVPPNAPIWSRVFDKITPNDRGYDIEEAFNPSGYGVTGQTMPAASSSLDPFLMRTNSTGNVITGCVDSVSLPFMNVVLVLDSMNLYYEQAIDRPINPTKINPTPVVRNLCILSGVTGNQYNTPYKFTLKQNYPNPFNPTTNIEFALPIGGFVTLKIYDITGKEIVNLINEYKNKGSYIMSFNASNLPGGTYFYRLTSGDFSEVKKMLLLK
ncbi:MAG: hypothetical protein A2W11_03265 [Ignavibacteria bacterium RBG_16_35_7]|nr:MAG: hypothetical protein A2W11_03265 [Ignavibacteria bacterium RBG_16_35_7]